MPTYLDYNATTPIRPEAIDLMKEIMAEPANSSSSHSYGRAARKWLEDARAIVAEAVHAWPDEVIFTASGTEGNTTALRSFPGKRILASAVEHSSVLKTVKADLIPVGKNGVVDLAALDKMMTSGALVSVMLANNETGVIQPIQEISKICKKHDAILHCDAVQALGKIEVDMGALGVDILTLGAHKCGGPVGAGALVLRRGLEMKPLFVGGKQEMNRRAGTSNVAAIAGFAKAIELFDFDHMKKLRGWLDEMEAEIASPWKGEAGRGTFGVRSLDSCPPPNLPPPGGGIVFGAGAPRLPNTSCIAMPGVTNEIQMMDLDLKGFAVSGGAACSSGKITASHVLTAMGVDEATAICAIRASGGWKTTEADIKAFTSAWNQTSGRLMKKAG